MEKTATKNTTFKLLKASFEKKYQGLMEEFEERHADSLAWIAEKGIDVEALPTQAAKGAAAGAAAGVMLLSSGIAPSRELAVVQQERQLPAGGLKSVVR